MSRTRRVAFSGSRGFTDRALVVRSVDRVAQSGAKILVPCGDSGCTAGVDSFVHRRVWEMGYEHDTFKAEWKRFGKGAGYKRNEKMVAHATEIIAFMAPGPSTPGTAHALLCAQRLGIAMHVYHEGKWLSTEPMT